MARRTAAASGSPPAATSRSPRIDATFALSEAKLGLIPATISPYVIEAIGARQARRYFLTAERFEAAEAYRIGLVHDIVPGARTRRSRQRDAGRIAARGTAGAARMQGADPWRRASSDRRRRDRRHRGTHRRGARVARRQGRRRRVPRQARRRRGSRGSLARRNDTPISATSTRWQLVALAAAVGWASGLRLYAVLFIVGAVGYLDWVQLPSGLDVLAHPYVLAASGFMCFIEFFADKIPGVDSAWDRRADVHPDSRWRGAGRQRVRRQFARRPCSRRRSSAARSLPAATSRRPAAAPSSTRRPSPSRTGRPRSARISRSARVLWLAFAHPLVALVVLAVLVALMIWLIPKVWRMIRALFAARVRLVRRPAAPSAARPPAR